MTARSDDAGLTWDPTLLAKWRADQHLTQSDVARALHYHQSLIAKIERGQARPTERFLEALERHFNVSSRRFYRRALGVLLALLAGL